MIYWKKCSVLQGLLQHGTTIQTGITSKKSLVICATHLAGGAFLKMQKYFEAMLNMFEIIHV